MKKFKISVALLILVTMVLFSVSHAFARTDVSPQGREDIPSIFSFGEVQ